MIDQWNGFIPGEGYGEKKGGEIPDMKGYPPLAFMAVNVTESAP